MACCFRVAARLIHDVGRAADRERLGRDLAVIAYTSRVVDDIRRVVVAFQLRVRRVWRRQGFSQPLVKTSGCRGFADVRGEGSVFRVVLSTGSLSRLLQVSRCPVPFQVCQRSRHETGLFNMPEARVAR